MAVLILGPNPEAQYERGYEFLHPGAVLLLYTDGIVEAGPDGAEMFGVERLKRIIAAKPWSSARDLVEEIFERVNRFSEIEPPLDDQTVVAVIRTAD